MTLTKRSSGMNHRVLKNRWDFLSQEIVDETDVYALGLSFRKLLGTDGIPMGSTVLLSSSPRSSWRGGENHPQMVGLWFGSTTWGYLAHWVKKMMGTCLKCWRFPMHKCGPLQWVGIWHHLRWTKPDLWNVGMSAWIRRMHISKNLIANGE